MTSVLRYVFLLLGLLWVAGCAGRPYRALGERGCPGAVGLASWYGKDFHGRKTSSGVRYDMYGLSAAHRTFPFGTRLRVTACQSGRRVDVVVNDRGPFIKDRVLDLSFGAAKVLGIVVDGVAKVGIQPLSDRETTEARKQEDTPPEDNVAVDRSGVFLVQVGAYQVHANALRMQERIQRVYPNVYIETHETNFGPVYRVRVGPYTAESEAYKIATEIPDEISAEDAHRQEGLFSPVVVRSAGSPPISQK